MRRPAKTTLAGLACAALALAPACKREQPRQKRKPASQLQVDADDGAETGGSESDSETGDPRSGEAAHVIPFADRTSMGYLLLLPAGDKPKPPTREFLQGLVEQAFPERRNEGEIDLLLTMIASEPHSTDYGGTLEAPDIAAVEAELAGKQDEAGDADEAGEANDPDEGGAAEVPEEVAAKLERQRTFDLIGLHIELIHLGLGEKATISSEALRDPVLTRTLSPEQRASIPGRSWMLLLRADYRNQNAVRGLRLHQTLVRIVAEHYGALIHDPDTLETMDVEAFTEHRLRAAAGNVADQIAIVPFPDPEREDQLRLSTRGMRRFGAVDLELAGLPQDPVVLQRASDLLAGLALALVKEGEVDETGFAVEVPDEIEVDVELIRQSYSARDYEPPRCEDCPGVTTVHLVERPAEDQDPEDHVVARVVAPRPRSDAEDYDHPKWVREALAELFG